MKDDELVLVAAALIAAYYFIVLQGKQGAATTGRNALRGRMSTGRSGTVAGGASKAPTNYHNTNRRTNAQTRGAQFSPAPIAWTGPVAGSSPLSSNVGGRRQQGFRSARTTGMVGNFVANQWPSQRVTSTSFQRIGSGMMQVPSYSAVPLTVQGVGGGGSLVTSAN